MEKLVKSSDVYEVLIDSSRHVMILCLTSLCLGRASAQFPGGNLSFFSARRRSVFAGFVSQTASFVYLEKQMTRNAHVTTQV